MDMICNGDAMFQYLLDAQQNRTPLVVAELGAKYAELDVMKQMIKSCKDCGADMVKIQTYQAETISTPGSFFTMEDGSRISQYDFFKAYELTREDHSELVQCCEKEGIGWFSTPSHQEDVELLEAFDPVCYKTGSDDLTNLQFLKYVSERQRPMIVSTGMCTLGEIEKAVETIRSTGNEQLVLMHCVVSYPSKPEDANLRVIETLKRAFGLPVGLSDHTQSEFTSILATSLGVVMVEKHFTPDHALGLPDHKAALDPAEFRELVQKVRLVPQVLGDGIKRILDTEKKWRVAGRKSVFTLRKIKKGQVLQKDDLTIRRPADGIHPHYIELIVGRHAAFDISENTLLTWNMV